MSRIYLVSNTDQALEVNDNSRSLLEDFLSRDTIFILQTTERYSDIGDIGDMQTRDNPQTQIKRYPERKLLCVIRCGRQCHLTYSLRELDTIKVQ